MSADPLGFFAGEASSSSEDEEDDGGTQQPEETTKTSEDAGDRKLPSPDTLFATVGRPSFLDNPLEGHINWDRFVKTQETSPEPNVHSSEGYAAIPPPNLDESSDTPQSISAAPVKYTTPTEGTDPKLLTVSSGNSSTDSQTKAGTKRSHEETEDESSKKKKGETFRQKEKRKRDLGQSSRGKSYVEEEKRILRQAYGMEENK